MTDKTYALPLHWKTPLPQTYHRRGIAAMKTLPELLWLHNCNNICLLSYLKKIRILLALPINSWVFLYWLARLIFRGNSIGSHKMNWGGKILIFWRINVQYNVGGKE